MPDKVRCMSEREFNQLVGRNIATFRQAKGWTQTELVERMRVVEPLGWHQQTVGKVESGSRPLKFSEAMDLAKVLDIEVGELYDPSEASRVVATVKTMLVGVRVNRSRAMVALQEVGMGLAHVLTYATEFEHLLPGSLMEEVLALGQQPDIADEANEAVAVGWSRGGGAGQ